VPLCTIRVVRGVVGAILDIMVILYERRRDRHAAAPGFAAVGLHVAARTLDFIVDKTGDVIADLVAGWLGSWIEFLPLAPDGHNLPAAAQADVLRCDRHASEAATIKTPVVLLPVHRFIRGEMPVVAAGVRRAPECRSGYP
jgi:hypothetical protein